MFVFACRVSPNKALHSDRGRILFSRDTTLMQRPRRVNLLVRRKIMNHEIISQLKSQNTGRLFGLSIITYFVYPAHYLRRQTKIINQHCQGEDKIFRRIRDDHSRSFLRLACAVRRIFIC